MLLILICEVNKKKCYLCVLYLFMLAKVDSCLEYMQLHYFLVYFNISVRAAIGTHSRKKKTLPKHAHRSYCFILINTVFNIALKLAFEIFVVSDKYTTSGAQSISKLVSTY